MWTPRVIPCLLMHKGGLYKTVKFRDARYVGDPINAVRILNEKEVDELLLVDIDATAHGREPHFAQIEDIVGEAFMPVAYSGGVTSVEQMKRLFALGVEKVFTSSAALASPDLVADAAARFGSQSIGVVLDVKRGWGSSRFGLVTHNGRRKAELTAAEAARLMEGRGAGELLVNSVDRDGTMTGYDLEAIRTVTLAVGIPVIALGGAGSLADLARAVREGGASAAAAGSLFVFTGVHRAVLITYPAQAEIERLFGGGCDGA
ncbi:MAG: AglZ/HisF2 family acetamidino modification protein [Candidatus Bipolaricaulota bacterium]